MLSVCRDCLERPDLEERIDEAIDRRLGSGAVTSVDLGTLPLPESITSHTWHIRRRA